MDKQKPILVTGSSTGIGYDICNYLSENGFYVYAGVRKQSDFSRFKSERIQPVIVDVTRSDTINSCFSIIESQGYGLTGIVNNAGIGSLGFLSSFTETDVSDIFNVNVYGPWRLINKFTPLLVQSKGYIINIGSQGGVIGGKKLYGFYMMTKHALEVYTDTLREELEPHGVKVSIIEPGGIDSAIGNNSQEGILRRLANTPAPLDKEALQIKEFLSQPSPEFDENQPESATNRKASSPRTVSEVVLEVLRNSDPKPRYLVGTYWEGMRAIDHTIKLLLEVNDNPTHNFSLDKLIEILQHHHREYYNR